MDSTVAVSKLDLAKWTNENYLGILGFELLPNIFNLISFLLNWLEEIAQTNIHFGNEIAWKLYKS